MLNICTKLYSNSCSSYQDTLDTSDECHLNKYPTLPFLSHTATMTKMLILKRCIVLLLMRNWDLFEISLCENILNRFTIAGFMRLSPDSGKMINAVVWKLISHYYFFLFCFVVFLSLQVCKHSQMAHQAICLISLLWKFFTYKRKCSFVYKKP